MVKLLQMQLNFIANSKTVITWDFTSSNCWTIVFQNACVIGHDENCDANKTDP